MEPSSTRRLRWTARLLLFVLMLYVFLGAIKLLGMASKMAGAGAAESLFSGLENPFAGLAVGILATALVQSSSVTTATTVGLVATGELSVAHAVPIVMGANIGTSITCILVSLGHITQGQAFRRAFAGATVHDIFNLLTVAILFPAEMVSRKIFGVGILEKGATWIVASLPLSGTGGEFHSPINQSVKWLAKAIMSFFHDLIGIPGDPWLAGVLAVVALVMIVIALLVITKNMKALMADRIEQWLNRVLKRRGALGLLIGAVVTAVVQSSSITTSLLIPMFGAGVLTLEAGFPIMLGANIGTTITALLAATVAGPAGLTIAVVHLLFNVSGTLLFFPLKVTRQIPIILAEKLAYLATQNRLWVLLYVFVVFVAIPGLGILIWK